MNIFAGPFIGEFGWELSYWHAWLRFIKKRQLAVVENKKFLFRLNILDIN